MKHVNILIISSLLVTSFELNCHAGQESHGGVGLFCQKTNSVELLDLFEAKTGELLLSIPVSSEPVELHINRALKRLESNTTNAAIGAIMATEIRKGLRFVDKIGRAHV